MKRTIFTKIFSIVVLFTIVVLLLFSAIVTSLVYKYSLSEKNDLLSHDAYRVSESMRLLSENYSPALERVVLANILIMAQNSDSVVIIADKEGSIIYCTDTSVTGYMSKKVRLDFIDALSSDGKYSGTGTLGGVYSSSVFTVGLPISNGAGDITGGVFISSSTPYTRGLLTDMIKILLNASTLVILVAFGVTYIMVVRFTAPLKVMSNAAREYAKGNFNVRVPIETEDEFGELSMAFNNMASSLSQLENMRSAFIANVSHDLKTPMTTIAGFIDGILDGTIPSEKQEYYLKLVASEVRRLSRMVKGLLDLARFESGTAAPQRTKFDLCAMVCNILVGFEQRINEKNNYVEIHFEQDPAMVSADHDMIFQVVYNLIDNAVKFVNKDGIISIRIENEQKKVRCFIKNTGSGISAEDIDHIFDRFYKSDLSRSLDRNGVGLGLYIVRSIIIAHNETIDVNSVEGEFCEFSFTLPSA